MKILVTGAGGFIGRNLCLTLRAMQSDTREPAQTPVEITEVMEYDRNSTQDQLDSYCERAEFVFHIAGVNRAEDTALWQGNVELTQTLLKTLRRHNNPCPVMLASSIQATNDTIYGRSKRAAEELVLTHGREIGARVLIYRLPHLFGKWCRPYYNSAVATFCYQAANDLPITLHEPDRQMELLYIDDLLRELLDALVGREHRLSADCDYCCAPGAHHVTLGEVAARLETFRSTPTQPPLLPHVVAGSFESKLYATYLSYLPRGRSISRLLSHRDERGSFTELMHLEVGGQVSVNITRPGAVKGRHWHHSKWEVFVVVSGQGRILQRRPDSDEVLTFDVSGDAPSAVYILPGYVHSLENLSSTDDLITITWSSERYDPARADTYRDKE